MFFFFQAEDGIRYLVRSRGLGDVYKRQIQQHTSALIVDGGAFVSAFDALLRDAVPDDHQQLSLIHI